MTEALRETNIALGVVAFALLCWRTPQIVMRLTSKRLYFSLASFPVLVCFGSVWALSKHIAPSPVLPCFTLAYISLAATLIWLPRGLRS